MLYPLSILPIAIIIVLFSEFSKIYLFLVLFDQKSDITTITNVITTSPKYLPSTYIMPGTFLGSTHINSFNPHNQPVRQ